jgi:hypothetical protein
MSASHSRLVGTETKDAILDAAVRLAAREGLRATSMQAIAREVGLNESGLYRHFPSQSRSLHVCLFGAESRRPCDGVACGTSGPAASHPNAVAAAGWRVFDPSR